MVSRAILVRQCQRYNAAIIESSVFSKILTQECTVSMRQNNFSWLLFKRVNLDGQKCHHFFTVIGMLHKFKIKFSVQNCKSEYPQFQNFRIQFCLNPITFSIHAFAAGTEAKTSGCGLSWHSPSRLKTPWSCHTPLSSRHINGAPWSLWKNNIFCKIFLLITNSVTRRWN